MWRCIGLVVLFAFSLVGCRGGGGGYYPPPRSNPQPQPTVQNQPSRSNNSTRRCYQCDGGGKQMCSNCNGRGYYEELTFPDNKKHPAGKRVKHPCKTCRGSGGQTCYRCGGKGWLR